MLDLFSFDGKSFVIGGQPQDSIWVLDSSSHMLLTEPTSRKKKEKEEKMYCFAFIRYTTKGEAFKAITEMNNMNMRGYKIGVKEAYHRRGNKAMRRPENGFHEVRNASPRNASMELVKVVNEREKVLANELVMMIREEDRENKSRVLVSHDILDEWSFSSYKEKPFICATEKVIHEVLSDMCTDYQYFIAREKKEIEDRGDLLQLQHMEKLPHLGYLMMEEKE
ncbi:hypothetical protein PIB30_040649 [Stylosanthes scabra]|uniref:RRM domain-containing protein n=1 Tax=Stylosanthes scabra TaxID=79078 RepID=A0ABU6WD28_9FABA|nr:hypothetical protein [Stylosanthes scabra]